MLRILGLESIYYKLEAAPRSSLPEKAQRVGAPKYQKVLLLQSFLSTLAQRRFSFGKQHEELLFQAFVSCLLNFLFQSTEDEEDLNARILRHLSGQAIFAENSKRVLFVRNFFSGSHASLSELFLNYEGSLRSEKLDYLYNQTQQDSFQKILEQVRLIYLDFQQLLAQGRCQLEYKNFYLRVVNLSAELSAKQLPVLQRLGPMIFRTILFKQNDISGFLRVSQQLGGFQIVEKVV